MKIPHFYGSGQLFDLAAYLGTLAFGAGLIAFGHVAVGSLAAACAALGGLYGCWKRLRTSSDKSDADPNDDEPDQCPPAQGSKPADYLESSSPMVPRAPFRWPRWRPRR